MEKCANCQIEYPSEILSPAVGLGTSGSLCGICALELTNKLLGDNRTKFNGKMAESFRLSAIEWRNKQASTRH
jgi:hypothetical protein